MDAPKSYNLRQNNQQGLNIEVNEDCKFRANINYQGKFLSFKSKNLTISEGQVTAPNGFLKLQANQTLNLLQSYIQAKGIALKAEEIDDKVNKYLAGLEGLFL